MFRKNHRIIAIDPGTKYIGYAIFEKEKLIYHGVETITNKYQSSEVIHEVKKIITRLINDFSPEVLAIEKTFFGNNQRCITLNKISRIIHLIGRRKGLVIKSYAVNTIRKIVCGDGHTKKQDVAKILVSIYPELRAYILENDNLKNRFHQNMFDAVAVGVLTYRTSK